MAQDKAARSMELIAASRTHRPESTLVELLCGMVRFSRLSLLLTSIPSVPSISHRELQNMRNEPIRPKNIFRVMVTSFASILKPRLRSLQALASLLASQSNHTLRVCRELRTYPPPSYLLLPPSLFQPCAVSPLFVVGLHRFLVMVAAFAIAICGLRRRRTRRYLAV